jgi:hypothetical protein
MGQFLKRKRSKKIVFTREQLEPIIAESKSYQDVFRKLNCKKNGHYYRVIKRLARQYELSTSHFTGSGWNKGLDCKGRFSVPLDRILVENSTYTNTNRIRQRLIRTKTFLEQCNRCKLTQWLGQKIPLELEHKNGIRSDCRIENLELLCPNCHALTEHYCGRNKRSRLLRKSVGS